jgi:hypothetical protein
LIRGFSDVGPETFPNKIALAQRTGGAKVINYFTFDGGPTAQVYFYGFDGSYLGTMQPPGFP